MRALVISADAAVRAEIAAALARALPAMPVDVLSGGNERAELAARGASARMCFLDVSGDPTAAFQALDWLAADLPRLPVIALVPSEDPELILQALRRGAVEFLGGPFTPEETTLVVHRASLLAPETPAGNPAAGGQVIVVLPGKGNTGATTIATALAFALKRVRGGRVLLADLDGLAGTVGFLLKLKSSYSFLDALKHSSGLDREIWKALAAGCQGIEVLLAPETPADCPAEACDPTPIISSARQAYDTVVIDGGSALGAWNTILARLADELLLVTTNELAAVQGTQRSLQYLARHGVDRQRARILVNRYCPRAPLRRDAIEKALETIVFQVLPADPDALHRALMEGRPPNPASDFGKAVTALARTLSGRSAPARKGSGSLLARLLAVLN